MVRARFDVAFPSHTRIDGELSEQSLGLREIASRLGRDRPPHAAEKGRMDIPGGLR